MKNEKVCPKCTSLDLIKIPGNLKFGIEGNSIRFGYIFSSNGLTVFLTRYVCTNCGFSEEWIEEKNRCKNEKAKNEINELDHDESNFSETPPWDKKNLL